MTATEHKWAEKVEPNATTVERCPYCGGAMREMLRAEESHSVFIWYECSANDCPGRKLKQYSLV